MEAKYALMLSFWACSLSPQLGGVVNHAAGGAPDCAELSGAGIFSGQLPDASPIVFHTDSGKVTDAENRQVVEASLKENRDRDPSLAPAGVNAELDRYIGYWKPYATSHQELDADHDIQGEVRNAARALMARIVQVRRGEVQADRTLQDPRQK